MERTSSIAGSSRPALPKRSRSLSLFRLFRRGSVSEQKLQIERKQSRSNSVTAVFSTTSRSARGRILHFQSLPSLAQKLPQEIHDNILRYVRLGHEEGVHNTCSTCMARDMAAYSMTCKGWNEAALPHLYSKVLINGQEAHRKHQKRKAKDFTRSAALLRTLTARPDYAILVRELKLPEFNRDTITPAELGKMVETAAAIVRCTRNLERFIGPYTGYGGGWDSPLSQALSTCVALKENVIMFEDDTSTVAAASARVDFAMGRRPSKLERSREFAKMFARWRVLETLVLQGCGQEPDVDFVGAFTNLPRLKNLMISNFKLNETAALALQAVPASVIKLRLENLHGLTGRALKAFAVSRRAKGLNSLTLVNIKLLRLQDLTPLFRLRGLESFTIADSLDEPYFEETTDLAKENIGYWASTVFMSPTLKFLHWDILVHPLVEATLARAIQSGSAGGDMGGVGGTRGGSLPELRRLRAPSDRSGTLQAVCKPREAIAWPSDWIYEAPGYHVTGPPATSYGLSQDHSAGGIGRPRKNSASTMSMLASTSSSHPRKGTNLFLSPSVPGLPVGGTPSRSSSISSNISISTAATASTGLTAISASSSPTSASSVHLFPPRTSSTTPPPHLTATASRTPSPPPPPGGVTILKAFGQSMPEFAPFPRALSSARIRAQKRLERAKKEIVLHITAVDEDGTTTETVAIGGYMGDLKSRVLYDLSPDALFGIFDEKTGAGMGMARGRDWALVSFEKDVLENIWRKETDLGSGIGKGVCNGGWNARMGVVIPAVKRGGKDVGEGGRGAHAERRKIEGEDGRVSLMRLFGV